MTSVFLTHTLSHLDTKLHQFGVSMTAGYLAIWQFGRIPRQKIDCQTKIPKKRNPSKKNRNPKKEILRQKICSLAKKEILDKKRTTGKKLADGQKRNCQHKNPKRKVVRQKMNCYHVTKCPSCRKPILLEPDSSELTIMVHGADATERALTMLLTESTRSVAGKFCQNCGHEKPCGCGCEK